MSWCEQLTRRAEVPRWNGPARVHNLLSAEDEGAPQAPEPQEPVDEKVCPGCDRCLPATKQHFYSHSVRGKPYLHIKCKECMRAEQVERDSRRSRKGKR